MGIPRNSKGMTYDGTRRVSDLKILDSGCRQEMRVLQKGTNQVLLSRGLT